MIEWHLETYRIKKLKDHPKNARTLSKSDHAQLTKSIDKFGLIDKPIINTDGTIIGGHQRIKILLEMGETEVEVWMPNRELEEYEVDELNIRLNRNTGEWDWDIIANEWEVEDLHEWGFSEHELFAFGEEEKDDGKAKDEKEKKPTLCDRCKKEIE